jgi:hypothetical protein
MKLLVIILAFTGILLQTFYSGFIVANYEMNKDYISKNLCENRNKPKMHCNGKCHLRKQLAAQEKKENTPLSQNLKIKFEVQFCSETLALKFPQIVEDTKNNFSYLFLFPTTSPNSIFHPPQA